MKKSTKLETKLRADYQTALDNHINAANAFLEARKKSGAARKELKRAKRALWNYYAGV